MKVIGFHFIVFTFKQRASLISINSMDLRASDLHYISSPFWMLWMNFIVEFCTTFHTQVPAFRPQYFMSKSLFFAQTKLSPQENDVYHHLIGFIWSIPVYYLLEIWVGLVKCSLFQVERSFVSNFSGIICLKWNTNVKTLSHLRAFCFTFPANTRLKCSHQL